MAASRVYRPLLLCVLALVLSATAGYGVPGASTAPAPPKLAEDMQEWVDWALHGTEGERCPSVVGDANLRLCLWPARLAVTLEPPGATFRQDAFVERDGWVALPGSADLWPQDVRLDGTAAVVTETAGTPRLWVPSGPHVLTGAFAWTTPPAAIAVPPATAVVTLAHPGDSPRLAQRDPADRLWLDRRVEE